MKNTFPIMYVLMSSKDYHVYLNLFRKIKQLLEDMKMKIDFKNISFMTDFENRLRKALKMNLMMLLFMDAIFILLKIFGIKPKNMIYLKKL